MSEIKYELVNGEPVCSGAECNYSRHGAHWIKRLCIARGGAEGNAGRPCIPGLRQQRDAEKARADKVEAERDEARAALKLASEYIASTGVCAGDGVTCDEYPSCAGHWFHFWTKQAETKKV